MTSPLSDDELRRIDAWWRAANYLSVGQIYLRDNPLLRRPLHLLRLPRLRLKLLPRLPLAMTRSCRRLLASWPKKMASTRTASAVRAKAAV